VSVSDCVRVFYLCVCDLAAVISGRWWRRWGRGRSSRR